MTKRDEPSRCCARLPRPGRAAWLFQDRGSRPAPGFPVDLLAGHVRVTAAGRMTA